ncbi:MAG TPA: hypothetical protein VIR60_02660, partial [Gammaproteobacteria bacterium]
MTDRSLLAALIAGLLLPQAANAQSSTGQAAGFAWNCRQDPDGAWVCTTAPADVEPPPAQTAPVPVEPSEQEQAQPLPATPAQPPASA